MAPLWMRKAPVTRLFCRMQTRQQLVLQCRMGMERQIREQELDADCHTITLLLDHTRDAPNNSTGADCRCGGYSG